MPALLLLGLIVAGTVIGLAGTDLILPAIPALPDYLDGSVADAQLVLAAFTAGLAAGLLIFGELGARFNQKRLLVSALTGYGVLSGLAIYCTTITELSVARLVQGFFAAAPAVFAPGMIRALFDDRQALRAIGVMGSIESVVPALAPVLGAWLLGLFGWQSSFKLIGILALLLAAAWLFTAMPASPTVARGQGGYGRLLINPVFQRYSISHACSIGGLLIFVFGAPTVMIVAMKGTLSDFVTMQVIGISLFVITTNLVHKIVERLGAEFTIMFGSALTAAGCLMMLVYAVSFAPRPEVIWFLFSFVNVGIGLRGPPGFYQAIVASGDDDARGAALVMLSMFAIVAAGTAALAPYISLGLAPLAGLACAVASCSLIALALMPKLTP